MRMAVARTGRWINAPGRPVNATFITWAEGGTLIQQDVASLGTVAQDFGARCT